MENDLHCRLTSIENRIARLEIQLAEYGERPEQILEEIQSIWESDPEVQRD
jgi:hypothetical protein